jgi:hypothetical protein
VRVRVGGPRSARAGSLEHPYASLTSFSENAAIIADVLARVGVVAVATLVCAAVALAATPPKPNLANGLKAFKRPQHAYDVLPKSAKALAPAVVSSRRVATAVDTKKNQYYVYITQMRNKQACIVLIQGQAVSSHCKPVTLFFDQDRKTTSVTSGLIGGVAENDVTKIVLVGGGKRKTITLTPDNGYLWGCPAPTNCAKWVRNVLGYNAAGTLISTEQVQ